MHKFEIECWSQFFHLNPSAIYRCQYSSMCSRNPICSSNNLTPRATRRGYWTHISGQLIYLILKYNGKTVGVIQHAHPKANSTFRLNEYGGLMSSKINSLINRRPRIKNPPSVNYLFILNISPWNSQCSTNQAIVKHVFMLYLMF